MPRATLIRISAAAAASRCFVHVSISERNEGSTSPSAEISAADSDVQMLHRGTAISKVEKHVGVDEVSFLSLYDIIQVDESNAMTTNEKEKQSDVEMTVVVVSTAV